MAFIIIKISYNNHMHNNHKNSASQTLSIPILYMQAGLCSKATRSQLVIALEPVCAAVFVRSQRGKSKALRSTDYAVVDCGGGTVDIAYHSLEKKGEDTFIVRELAPPSGGPFGGTLVDRAFEMLLEKIFGKPLPSKHGKTPFIDRLKTEYTDAWMDLMREFEACKTTLYGKEPHETIRFRLDQNFGEACFEISKARTSNLIKQCGLKGVSLSPTRMLLVEVRLLTELFRVPIQQIKRCLESDLGRLRSISALYMVGSFSSSNLLFHSIQEEVKGVKKENIIRPQESGLAVVKGAVTHGFCPSIMQEPFSVRNLMHQSTQKKRNSMSGAQTNHTVVTSTMSSWNVVEEYRIQQH